MADPAMLRQERNKYFPAQLKDLLDIIESGISGIAEAGSKNINRDEYAKLAALSAQHKIEYYLFNYFQLNPSPVLAGELKQLREKMTGQAVKSLQQLSELLALCKNFNQKGIPYAVIKGPHLARMLYGNASVKVSVDLDIMMVNPGDLAAFHQAFMQADYVCMEQHLMTGTWKQRLFVSAKREVHYFNRKAGCTVDLHVKPLANTVLTAGHYRDFFADIVQEEFEGITIPVLPSEKYFVYLCYHAACHQLSRLAWLLDILNFYRKKKDGMELDKMLATARSLNMERSVYLAFMMLNVLFEVQIPGSIKSSIESSGLLRKLAINCLRAISLERGEDLKLKPRFDRMVYLVRLNKGLASKADVLLSMVMRQRVGVVFRRNK